MNSVPCTVYGVRCMVYSAQCTVYSLQCTTYSVQCTVLSVYCTVHSVNDQYTKYNVEKGAGEEGNKTSLVKYHNRFLILLDNSTIDNHLIIW